MAELEKKEPWERIIALVHQADAPALQAYLHELTPGDVARAFTRFDDDENQRLLTLLGPESSAALLQELADAQAADILEELPPEHASAIFEEMESDHRADLLAELDEDDAEAILQGMTPEEAQDARNLLRYEEDTAGGVMVTEFVVYPQDMRVGDVLRDMRDNAEQYSDYGVQYAYVQSAHGTLIGVLRLRDLLLSPADKQLSEVMIVNPVYLLDTAPLSEVNLLFDRYSFWCLPVTDEHGRMVGVLRRADAEEAMGEEHGRNFLRFSGIIGGEELRSMPLGERTSHRLLWLCLNMALSITAASVILRHQQTVENLFALVFFMPIICNMSGCSGNQAVAVSIRELTLGLIKPKDYLRVWGQEVSVGLINGSLLGLVLGAVAYLGWHGTPFLGFIIGGAFALNTMVAVSLGGLVPLLLRAIKVDPALGAPPILTTLTDMCGFAMVLTFARIALDMGLLN